MKLKRPLRGSETGADVRMVQRALNRWTAGAVPLPLSARYDLRTSDRVMAFQADRNIHPASGKFGQRTLDALWPYFDAYGRWRYRLYMPPKPGPALCFPLPAGTGNICQGLHETAGIPGNWAMDFCAPPGTPIHSPESGIIERLSGHDPSTAKPNPEGVYGWSTYVRTAYGYVYYVTHMGKRASLGVGASVARGQTIGWVGDQRPYTGRPDHAHIGVNSPRGEADAKKRITAVSVAPPSSPREDL